jgi:hypothetical protein
LYELVKPVFQQIFLPLRSASVIAPARAHTEWPDTTAAKMIGILRIVSTPFFAPRKSGTMGTYHIQEENAISYEEDKKRRLGIDSVIPRRPKYKQFSR